MSSNKYDDLTLVGTVKLDEQSIIDLKRVVREDVIKEYESKGIILSDVKNFMKNTDPVTLYHILCGCIDDVLSEVRVGELRHSCDGKKIEKLEVVRQVLRM